MLYFSSIDLKCILLFSLIVDESSEEDSSKEVGFYGCFKLYV